VLSLSSPTVSRYGVTFPAKVALDMAEGRSLVRAWRDYRGLTLAALASAADMEASHIAMLEMSMRPLTRTALTRLARALDVPLGALVD
jgi:hypothetical protein